MSLDDFKCDKCGAKYADCWEAPMCCDIKCVKDWEALNPNTVFRENMHKSDRAPDGTMLRAGVKDSPLATQQLTGGKYCNFSEDQKVHYLSRMLREGDSSKLRRDILRDHYRNQGKEWINTGRE